MKTPSIVKRLVSEIGAEPEVDEDDNLPIEYYELRELAKTRVLLKSSLKTHLFIYVAVNIFLLILNLLGNIPPISSFTDLWSLWSILGWGLLLLAHSMILATNNVPKLEYRIFIITSVVVFYIGLFLIYLNYYLIYAKESVEVWWFWPDLVIILFIAAYAWIVFYSENKQKFKTRVEREMNALIKKEEIKNAKKADEMQTEKEKKQVENDMVENKNNKS